MFIVFVNLCMHLYVISDCVWTYIWIITVCDFKLGTTADNFLAVVLEPLLIMDISRDSSITV
jgi:hypothetical protein